MRFIPLLFASSLLLTAGDQGVAPRPGAADYPAHQDTGNASLAAAIVPAKQVEKTFSADIARHYVVIEVAIYPQNGQPFDVDWLDFGLKIGDVVVYVEKPRDVATPWPDKGPTTDKPVTVVTEAGVGYGRTNDPVNGRRSGWSTYEGVGVTNDPRAAPPPSPRQGPDPQVVEQRVARMMLPEGTTGAPIAGYLFFPEAKRRKGAAMYLQWTRKNSSASLRIVEK